MNLEGTDEKHRLWFPESDRRAKLARLLAMMSGTSLHRAQQVDAAVRQQTVFEDIGLLGPREVEWSPVVRAEWNLHRQPPFGHGR